MNQNYTTIWKQPAFRRWSGLLAILLLLAPVLGAQTTFTGAVNNDWNNPANWDNGLPGPGNDALIPAGKTAVNSGFIFATFSVEIQGTLVNNGTFANLDAITNAGTLENAFIGAINNSGDLVNHGSLTNNGTLSNFGTGVLRNDGSLSNFGQVDNFAEIENLPAGTFDNVSGTVSNGALILNRGTWKNGGDLLTTLTFSNFGTLENTGLLENSGTLDNEGTLLNFGELKVFNTLTNALGALLDNRGTLTSSGTVSNAGQVVSSDSIGNGGQWSNLPGATFSLSGRMENFSAGVLTNEGHLSVSGFLKNVGRLDNDPGATLLLQGTLRNGGTFNNRGEVDIQSGGYLANSALLDNRGSLLNRDSLINFGGTLLNFGGIENRKGLRNFGVLENHHRIDNLGHIQNINRFENTGELVNDSEVENHFCAEFIHDTPHLLRAAFTNNGILRLLQGDVEVTGGSGVVFDNLFDQPPPPTAVCQDIDFPAGGILKPEDVNFGSFSPGCLIESMSVSPNQFDCEDIGLHQVTLTVTNAFGESDVCTAQVNVVPPQDVVIQPTELPQFCQGSEVELKALSETAASYLWSTGETTPSIFVSEAGTYSVTVVSEGGCQSQGSIELDFDPISLLSSYTILGLDEVELERFARVKSGNVGILKSRGEVELERYAGIRETVVTPDLDLEGHNFVGAWIRRTAPVELPKFQVFPYDGPNLYIPRGTTYLVERESYNKIVVGRNATAIFTRPFYRLREIETRPGAHLVFKQCTNVFLQDDLELEDFTCVNVANEVGVNFWVNDEVEIEEGSIFVGNVYAPHDELEVDDAEYEFERVVMVGQFIAEEVDAGDGSIWVANPLCHACPHDPDGSSLPAQRQVFEFQAVLSREGRTVDLTWAKNFGTRNDHFIVERSLDGQTFEPLGTLDAYQTNDAVQVFSFFDPKPAPGTNYYRIRLVLLSGTELLSEVRQVRLHPLNDLPFLLYPNPASDKVFVDLRDYPQGAVEIELVNSLGETLRRIDLHQAPESPLTLDLDGLLNGHYVVWVRSEGRKPVAQSLIIARSY